MDLSLEALPSSCKSNSKLDKCPVYGCVLVGIMDGMLAFRWPIIPLQLNSMLTTSPAVTKDLISLYTAVCKSNFNQNDKFF